MDLEWIKGVIEVIAQHGPWAVLAFFLIYKLLDHNKGMTEALLQTAKALEKLSARIDNIKPSNANGGE